MIWWVVAPLLSMEDETPGQYQYDLDSTIMLWAPPVIHMSFILQALFIKLSRYPCHLHRQINLHQKFC